LIKRVLVAVDGSGYSDRAFEYAAELAKAVNAEVYAIHVLQIPYLGPEVENNPAFVLQYNQYLQRQADTLLFKYYQLAKNKYDLEIKTILSKNQPSESILNEAEAKKVDLIVIGSRGLGGIKRLLLGSISNSVVQDSKIPVLIVK